MVNNWLNDCPLANGNGSGAGIKKRGQNSSYLYFEVFDYLTTKYTSKAHTNRRERSCFTLGCSLKLSKFQSTRISA